MLSKSLWGLQLVPKTAALPMLTSRNHHAADDNAGRKHSGFTAGFAPLCCVINGLLCCIEVDPLPRIRVSVLRYSYGLTPSRICSTYGWRMLIASSIVAISRSQTLSACG